ncbi:MAG: hypothetical protein IKU86_01445, partial [Thermoguttaceae bacterium]|nr:hypothetical protein [Thermoguttaceae bacterium]
MRWNSLLILMTSCALATGVGAFETTAFGNGATAATAVASVGFNGFNVENGGSNAPDGGPVVDVD